MITKFRITILFLFISFYLSAQQNYITVNGSVTDSAANKALPGCNVWVEGTRIGTSTVEDGSFTLVVPPKTISIVSSYVGYKTKKSAIDLTNKISPVYINIQLQPISIKSDEVTVTDKKAAPSTIVQEYEAKDMQLMPNIYNDITRSVHTLSGVTTNNELSSGYNVRGGSYDENLIYLNGYEIYRPFLLRNGVEENQNLVSPDMASGLKFYSGAFPVKYGDKMSSVLEVNYDTLNSKSFSGTARVDVLGIGMNAKKSFNNFKFNAAFRYAYPGAFVNSLQTRGDYKPAFSDIQILSEYRINRYSEIELLGIYAVNNFDLTPTDWLGNFGGFQRDDIRSLKIEYDGLREYKYTIGLFGVKYSAIPADNYNFSFSLSHYFTSENEFQNIKGDYYYTGQSYGSETTNENEYLKSRYEFADNKLSLNSFRVKSLVSKTFDSHNLELGLEYRFDKHSNSMNENIYETGSESILKIPYTLQVNKSSRLNSFSAYLEDDFELLANIRANFGVRFTRYELTNENLISPRISFIYNLNSTNTFTLSWGYYFQPPFINELRNPDLTNLKSQKAIHYILGWERIIKSDLKFSATVYYKDLENLIPFYYEDLKMIYVNGNTREGYSFGFDLQIDGEIVKGMRSVFGYGYLDSHERDKDAQNYQRRLTDQTHTLQIFLQDKMPKHPNWQSHLRFLMGTGLLFYNRRLVTDEETGNRYIEVDINNPLEYFLFFRVDMGLSASFDVWESCKLIVVAEVLNMFNHYNYAGYDWVQALKELQAPIAIPKVLSKRFFNLRLEFKF